jgi:O-antigen/teichoic acid export membrane protein
MTAAPPTRLAVTSAPGVKRGVAIGAVSQVGAKLLHLVLNIISTLAIVRYLAPGAYGVYAVVLTVSSLVALVADFGLPKLAVREICAGTNHDEDQILGTVVGLRLGLAVVGIAVTELILLALRQPGPAYVAGSVAALTGVGEAVLAAVVVVFQVRLVQQWEAILRTGAEVIETAAILVLVGRHASLAMLFVPPAVMTALAAVAGVLVVRHRYGRRLRFARERVKGLLIQALPIAPALLIGVLYHKLDSITLAALRPSRDIGLYSSAAQPIEYAFLTTALVMNTVFPLMSSAYSHGERDRFATLYRRGTESLIIITIAVPLVLLFVAEPLVVQVFGAPYADAATPLVLLSVAMVPLTVTVWQSLALLVGGFQSVTLQYNVATLIVSALLCVVLIAAFGMNGAGWAAVGTAVFAVLASTRAVWRRMGVRLQVAPMARIAIATATGAAVLVAGKSAHLPWLALAAIGLAAFAVAVRVAGAHKSLTGVVA